MDGFAPDTDRLATGLICVGADHLITWCNQAACTHLAKPPSGLLERRITDILPPSAANTVISKQHQQTTQISEVFLIDSGVTVDLSVTDLDDGRRLIEIYPITERIQQRIRADRIDQQQAITQLARHLAHELRNPLAGIKAAAQLIAQQAEAPDITRHADIIDRGTQRITNLLDRFSEAQNHQKVPVNLHQLLWQTAELVVAEHKGAVQIHSDFDTSIPSLLADKDQLDQLFLNLLRNSAQAQASLITLTTRIEHHSPMVNPPAKHAVRIEIRDNGDGVPEHLRERLFLPMVTGRNHGSGFGLAIAQQIARAHDGLIEYNSTEAATVFTCRLPLIMATDIGEHHA